MSKKGKLCSSDCVIPIIMKDYQLEVKNKKQLD